MPILEQECPNSAGELRRIWDALRIVRRRLVIAGFLRRLALDAIIGLAVASAVLLADRLFALDLPALLVVGGGLAAAIAAASLRTLVWGRPGWVDAARIADARLDLDERLSTALFVGETERAASFEGWRELIVRDGARALETAEIEEHFPVRVPSFAAWAVLPAAIALAVVLFVPVLDLAGLGAGREAAAAERESARKEVERLDRELEELAEEAKLHDVPELADYLPLSENRGPLAESQKAPEEGERNEQPGDGKSESGIRSVEQALVEVANREEAIRGVFDRSDVNAPRKALEAFQKASLRDAKPTRGLREALKRGDFKRARNELSKLSEAADALRRKLSSPGATAAAREGARSDLEKLSRELEELLRLARSVPGLEKASRDLDPKSTGGLEDLLRDPQALEAMRKALEELARQGELGKYLDQALQKVGDARKRLAAGDPKPPGATKRCPDCGKPLADKNNPFQQPGGT